MSGFNRPSTTDKLSEAIKTSPNAPVTVAAGSDPVAHPSHYNFGKIEVIEFIEDQQLFFHKGNAVKYICRAGRKDKATEVQDLEKAIWYLRREIETLKAEKEGRAPVRPNDMVKR